MSPFSSSLGRSLQAESYNLALADLAKAAPEAVTYPEVIDAVMGAVLDLASAGQTDAEALARYAACRGKATYDTLKG